MRHMKIAALASAASIVASPRGLLAVRAEAQPKKPASIEALASLFEEFKAAHTSS
jgi:hypothetical protein